ncbi:MAG: SDR family oxidoreductase [Proteobacteria bacterium]|nr:SDR family oxidoreductase [Pseudomonadota bacterium]
MAQDPSHRLFCFGLGYTALALIDALRTDGGDAGAWRVGGTCRGRDEAAALRDRGIEVFVFDGAKPMEDAPRTLEGATHILVSIPPADEGDVVLRHHGRDIAALASAAPRIRWLGYLSTTAVYGDRGGGWVDETSELSPSGARGRKRMDAEAGWLDLSRRDQVPVHIFRLAGIYGPGRSALDQARSGGAKRIRKPGQVFSRIHVADIAAVLMASMSRPNAGAVYNVSDDTPAPADEVLAFASELLGMAPPPIVAFANAELSEMARSFYADNKRVRNQRIKSELGVTLRYPDYKRGLAALAEEGRESKY